MSSEAFRRWATNFDGRYRFGMPVLPIQRKVDNLSPSIVELPARAGSMKFPADEVTATIELLAQCTPGQAVRLTDDPDGKENTSRRRAEIMKEQIEEVRSGQPIKAGYKLRGHVLTAGDPEVKKISGKNYKFYPQNWGAVSLVPDNEPETPAETPPETPENPAEAAPEGAGSPAPDAPDATDGKSKKGGK